MPISLREKMHTNACLLVDASKTGISSSSIPGLAVLIPSELLTLAVVPVTAPNETTCISIESKSFNLGSAIHDYALTGNVGSSKEAQEGDGSGHLIRFRDSTYRCALFNQSFCSFVRQPFFDQSHSGKPGRHRVRANSVRGPFDGKRSGHLNQAGLGHPVWS
jgi:hypothetical protein